MPVFGDIPIRYSKYENSKVVIIPAPFEGISTWLKGTTYAPDAILAASTHLEHYNLETGCETYKCGIFTTKPLSAPKMPDKAITEVYQQVKSHLQKDRFIIMLGGDHILSVGAAKAFADKYDDFCILQLDAHTELRSIYSRTKYNHACTGSRLREIAPLIQAGMRSMNASEVQYLEKDKHFFMKDLKENQNWLDNLVDQLSQNVYISIDLDVLDPSIMPSTRHPEPDGFSFVDLLTILKTICTKRNVVGCDFMELIPTSNSIVAEYSVSKLIYELIGFKYPQSQSI